MVSFCRVTAGHDIQKQTLGLGGDVSVWMEGESWDGRVGGGYSHKCANSKVGARIMSQAAFQFRADDTVMGLKLHPLSGKRGLTHMCSEEEGVADTVHHTTD